MNQIYKEAIEKESLSSVSFVRVTQNIKSREKEFFTVVLDRGCNNDKANDGDDYDFGCSRDSTY